MEALKSAVPKPAALEAAEPSFGALAQDLDVPIRPLQKSSKAVLVLQVISHGRRENLSIERPLLLHERQAEKRPTGKLVESDRIENARFDFAIELFINLERRPKRDSPLRPETDPQ